MTKEKLKSFEDFDDPVAWEAYLLSLFATRLNPKVNKEYAYDAALGYLSVLYLMEEEPGAGLIVELAEQILEGPAASSRTH